MHDQPWPIFALHRATGGVLGGLRGVADELFPHARDRGLVEAQRLGWRIDPPSAYCPRCGATAGYGAATARGCAFCTGQRLPWHRVVRLGPYRPPLSSWIVGMKFHNVWPWCSWFGRELAQAIDPGLPAASTLVCPVPMHFLRRMRRGYNQAHLIALALGRARRWPVAPILRRTRRTPPQTQVARSEREANVRRSFAARPIDLSGWDVVLVDDVKTTGSTLRACARLLRRAGAARVHGAVVAVADPKGGDFQTLS